MTEKIRTLVVDDESLARRGLVVRLQEFEQIELLQECPSAREALEVIGREQPDLVFLDIQMPGMNGFELLREVQSHGYKMPFVRSEEHTSELQSRENLVCRLLLEKKKNL